jgi:hypothetical protein
LASFDEFWPYYLREHRKPATRGLHYLGTALSLGCVGALALSGNFWFLAAALVTGYGPAWISHYFIEHNRPATFQHPWWSLISDFRMFLLWLSFRLGPELTRAGVSAASRPRI